MLVLAGDVGGTHCRLALVEPAEASTQWNIQRELDYASADHESLGRLVRDFLAGDAVDAAGFGVAGPVVAGQAHLTNLPWVVREDALREVLGVPVRLLNDFHAAALGVRHQIGCVSGSDSGIAVLQAGGTPDPTGPRLIIGAGTGLGKAIDVGGRILSSEGGHIDFAPRTPEETRLLQALKVRHRRVSVERIVSGPGLAALHAFRTGNLERRPSVTTGADIAAAAAAGDRVAQQALDWFVELYGAEAGNFALSTLPTGGLFITGGIAPKLVAQMGPRFGELFRKGFVDKGRMSALLETFQVSVVLEKRVGLLGAAAGALELL